MIKVFTLDPNSLNSIDNLAEIRTNFGINNFRIIWQYPNHWFTLVKIVIRNNFRNKERKKYFELLIKMKKYIIEIPSDLIEGENNIDLVNWLQNACKLYDEIEYSGIISNKNPNGCTYITKIDELDNCPNFSVDKSYRVKREGNILAQAVAPLLYSSSTIHFVDPYFQFMKDFHIRPLLEFIKLIYSKLRVSNINKICYHTGDSVLKQNIIDKINNCVMESLPSNTIFNIIRWEDDKVHNRFILTNRGGMEFGIGLCDSDYKNNKEYDDIVPIPSKACYLKTPDGSYPYMDYNINKDYKEILVFSK